MIVGLHGCFVRTRRFLFTYFFLIQELDILDFKSRHWQMVLLFPKMSRPSLGPTQPPIKLTMGFFPGVKRGNREIYCSTLYSAEARNEWSNTTTPLLFLHGVARHNFTFRLTGLNLAVLSGMEQFRMGFCVNTIMELRVPLTEDELLERQSSQRHSDLEHVALMSFSVLSLALWETGHQSHVWCCKT